LDGSSPRLGKSRENPSDASDVRDSRLGLSRLRERLRDDAELLDGVRERRGCVEASEPVGDGDIRRMKAAKRSRSDGAPGRRPILEPICLRELERDILGDYLKVCSLNDGFCIIERTTRTSAIGRSISRIFSELPETPGEHVRKMLHFLSGRKLALTSSYLRQRRGPLYYFLLCYAQVAYAMIVAGCHNLILPSYAACHCAPILETARYVTGPPRCRIGLALSRTGATCDARTVRCTATTRGFCAVVHARCRW